MGYIKSPCNVFSHLLHLFRFNYYQFHKELKSFVKWIILFTTERKIIFWSIIWSEMFINMSDLSFEYGLRAYQSQRTVQCPLAGRASLRDAVANTALCCGSLLWGCVSADCCCSLALPGSCYLLGVMACEDIPGGPTIFYGFLMNLKQNWKKWCRTTSWVYSSSFFQLMLDLRWVFWKIPLTALVYFPFLRTY